MVFLLLDVQIGTLNVRSGYRFGYMYGNGGGGGGEVELNSTLHQPTQSPCDSTDLHTPPCTARILLNNIAELAEWWRRGCLGIARASQPHHHSPALE